MVIGPGWRSHGMQVGRHRDAKVASGGLLCCWDLGRGQLRPSTPRACQAKGLADGWTPCSAFETCRRSICVEVRVPRRGPSLSWYRLGCTKTDAGRFIDSEQSKQCGHHCAMSGCGG